MLPEGIPLKVLIKRRLSHGCALILDFLPFHQAGRFQTCRLNPHTHTYTWMFAHTYGFIMIYQCLSYVFQLRRDLWFRARGWRMLWKSQLRRFGPGSPDRSQLNHQKWGINQWLNQQEWALSRQGDFIAGTQLRFTKFTILLLSPTYRLRFTILLLSPTIYKIDTENQTVGKKHLPTPHSWQDLCRTNGNMFH